MTDSSNLSDYKNFEKLEVYDQLANEYDEPSARTRYHTLYSNLPSLKGKTVLDIPCGIGSKSRNIIINHEAEKVLSIDIVEEQILYSKNKDITSGITDGQIEYFVHDCKIPKKMSSHNADIGLCVHLFCFANTYQELLDMAECLYVNLKKGAECHILICSLSKHQNSYQKLEQFGLEIIKIDSWQNKDSEPRKFHTKYQSFNYDCWLWEYKTLCNALKESGFTKIEQIPYVADQDYRGKLDLGLYTSIIDGFIIKAIKT
jgi:ubiquinone/menaquinone biosynthesis C-methylase UbiE